MMIQSVIISQSPVTAFDHFHVVALDHSPITELADFPTLSLLPQPISNGSFPIDSSPSSNNAQLIQLLFLFFIVPELNINLLG